MPLPQPATLAIDLLSRWAAAAEEFWYAAPDGSGCFGPGYIHWGVQSNFNYAAALATLAAQPGVDRADHWQERALAALRFSLASHHTGDRPGLNGQHWGHSWISMLGIERAMHGIRHLHPLMTDADHAALRRVLTSEAGWVLHHGQRGGHRDINGALWNETGRNVPESNIWAGALLWRTAQMWPDEPEADAWRERAHAYFINGVSIPADADDERIVAGKPVRVRHVGPNFFPNYALDHHGYLNVGYMAICVSNAAMLHFDARLYNFDRPATIEHHHGDLWRVLRRMIFPDGRLARIGGDSRVRYSYCQEYLLPSLLYAADRWGDGHALDLAAQQVEWMGQEQDAGDGMFYAARLARMRQENPHYFTRLESDRACVLAMLLNYAPLVQPPLPPVDSFEASVTGGWHEAEHGALMHRAPDRLASFSWRAYGLTQALCQPPDASHLAEWASNLCPVVRFLGDDGSQPGRHRRLLGHWSAELEGGFLTCGSVLEGVDVRVDEGAACTDQATTHIAFAALPDGRTCIGLQLVIAADDRVGWTSEVKSLHLNIPNDLFNDNRRRILTSQGERIFSAPPAADEVLELHSRWANIDDRLGVKALYGGEDLRLERSTRRRGGRYASLFAEELCLDVRTGAQRVLPGDVLVDVGFAVFSGVDGTTTANTPGGPVDAGGGLVRGAWVMGADGVQYAFIANFGAAAAEVEVAGEWVRFAAGQARLFTR